MCIISRLVHRCHCRRRVILIVSHVAIVITIVVVSRCNTAHRAVAIAGTITIVVAIVVVVASNNVAIIVDFVARGAVAESEPKLGVNKTPWWPFIELPCFTVKLELGTIYFSCCGR
jgi:hypothetical protein